MLIMVILVVTLGIGKGIQAYFFLSINTSKEITTGQLSSHTKKEKKTFLKLLSYVSVIKLFFVCQAIDMNHVYENK